MDKSQSQFAQDILNALATSGRTDIPAVDRPDDLPGGADQKAIEANSRHRDAYHAHLNNLPASAFADFPTDTPEVRAKKAQQRKDLFTASLEALGLNK